MAAMCTEMKKPAFHHHTSGLAAEGGLGTDMVCGQGGEYLSLLGLKGRACLRMELALYGIKESEYVNGRSMCGLGNTDSD